MKRSILLVFGVVVLGLGLDHYLGDPILLQGRAQVQTIPDVIVLAKDAKLGAVTFKHKEHNSSNRNIDGTTPIACVECHHTAQPASELAKHPPLKTSWPADRTT